VIFLEFLTTLAAAPAAREKGVGMIMGAPNMLCAGSDSGNAPAAESGRRDLLNVLSPDHPASLLRAGFVWEKGLSMPNSTTIFTLNPAGMDGVADRDEIAQRTRSDFLRARRSIACLL
jgi:alpha-D-ribose 1-methylphosphonate 5-triphosphate diphosphatase